MSNSQSIRSALVICICIFVSVSVYMYLHVSAYLLWAAIGLPTLSVGLPGLCVGEVGRPVHTGQLVDACTVQKVNVLCACMSHWVGNDFQQQQQWQQLQQQATTTQRGLLAGLSKLCIRMCQTCWRSTKHAYAMLCHEHDSYDPQRDTQNYPVYIYTHTHTHIHSCCCLSAPCLLVYLLHIFKDTSGTATARGTSCDIPVWWASTLSPHVSHKLNSINSCSPPACLID